MSWMNVIGAAGAIGGGILGSQGGPDSTTSTQTTQIDPRFGSALDMILGQSLGLGTTGAQQAQQYSDSISGFNNLQSQINVMADT